MTEYSKKTFDDAIRTGEQLIGVKSLEQVIEIQSQYAKRIYETRNMTREVAAPHADANKRSPAACDSLRDDPR